MQLVWALLKVIESLLGICCLVVHIIAISDEEPIEHIVFYCGVFCGFSLEAAYGTTCILLNRNSDVKNEVIITFIGAVMYIAASVWSMYHAEMDFHVEYLSDFEEEVHPFFKNCRMQSIVSLTCGCVYMLHCSFACDILFTKKPENSELDDDEYQLHLYFICPLIHNYLNRYPWFRKYWTDDVRHAHSVVQTDTRGRVKSVTVNSNIRSSLKHDAINLNPMNL